MCAIEDRVPLGASPRPGSAARPFVQIAYFVPDVFAAAERFAADLGAGPFIVLEHIPLEESLHRGAPTPLDHTSAYGQHGGVMLELVQQNAEGPSPFRDLFAPGEQGLHHLAIFAPGLDAELARFAARGIETAFRARTAAGPAFAFVDTSKTHGHMIEIYEDGPVMRGFYAFVAKASEGWDGRDPVRSGPLSPGATRA